MKCLMCGAEFEKRTVYHRYCSERCRNRAHQRGLKPQHTRAAFVPYDFHCRNCGDHVIVTDPDDHRSVYCSAVCEREYWRRVTKKPTALTVHYTWELEWREGAEAC